MSRGGEIELEWGGEDRRFRLAIGQLRELQDRTNAGPLELLKRLQDGTWRVDDARDTLRLGLIGGGMKPDEAAKLVRQYVDDYGYPPIAHIDFAKAVLFAALFGPEDETVGKATADLDGPESSDSPTSTPAEPS